MTVRSMGAGFLAFGALFASTAGLAETRLMSDPAGVLAAPAGDLQCCSTGAAVAAADLGSAAHIPDSADAVATDGGSPGGVGAAAPAATVGAPAAPRSDVTIPAVAPAQPSSWASLLSSIVQLGGAASR